MQLIVENNLVLLSLVYFVKVICALQIKIARDQENIFHLELCVNKV